MRIAYVEDNPTNFSLVERVARMAQHTVVSYTEGEIALSALKTEVYDLILMDVELAGEMNGLDLVRLLRKHGLQTPIVAVTAYAMLGDREKCIEAGCNEYLPKPLPIAELVSTFAKYTELAKNAAAKPQPAVVAPVQEPAPLVAPNPESPISVPVEQSLVQKPEPTVAAVPSTAQPEPIPLVVPNPKPTAVLLEQQEPTIPATPPSVPTPTPPTVPPVTPPSVPTPTPPSVPPVAPPTVPPAEPPSVPKPTPATAPLTPLPNPPSEAKPLPTSPRGNTKPITLKPDNVVDNKS